MVDVRYSNYGSVVLDSLGNGSVSIPGPKPGQTITITRVSCFIASTKRIPTFQYYKGLTVNPDFVASSSTGHNDTDATPNITLYPGEFLTGIWAGADAGVTAFMNVWGILSYDIR